MTDTQAIVAAATISLAPLGWLAYGWRRALNQLPPWTRYDEHIAKCRKCRAKQVCHWGRFLLERAQASDHD